MALRGHIPECNGLIVGAGHQELSWETGRNTGEVTHRMTTGEVTHQDEDRGGDTQDDDRGGDRQDEDRGGDTQDEDRGSSTAGCQGNLTLMKTEEKTVRIFYVYIFGHEADN